MLNDDPVTGGVVYQGGDMELPRTLGHGADIDPEFPNKCESVTIK